MFWAAFIALILSMFGALFAFGGAEAT